VYFAIHWLPTANCGTFAGLGNGRDIALEDWTFTASTGGLRLICGFGETCGLGATCGCGLGATCGCGLGATCGCGLGATCGVGTGFFCTGFGGTVGVDAVAGTGAYCGSFDWGAEISRLGYCL